MSFQSKLRTLLHRFGYQAPLRKKLLTIERNLVFQISSASSIGKVDLDRLEVPSRYSDVPISNMPYFDYIWENRQKHFDKVAMVSKHFLM